MTDARPRTTATPALVVAWVAIAFGVVSLPLAVVAIDGEAESVFGPLWIDVTPFTAIVSWLLATLAAILALVAMPRRRRTRRAVVALGLSAPGAVLGLLAMVGAVIYVGNLLGLFQANVAEAAAKPAVAAYTGHGAQVLCENGDNGYGIDNRQPWKTVYLDAPASLGAHGTAQKAVGAVGFGTAERADPGVLGADEPSPGSFAYAAKEAGRSAEVTVVPAGEVDLDCTTPDIRYGEKRDVTPGRVIVRVDVSFPDR